MSDSQIPQTRLESINHLRRGSRKKGERTPTVKEAVTSSVAATGGEVAVFRPTHRPPMALVCVLDDGQIDGRWVRVHADSFVIGRTEGDLTIPYDNAMSGRHMELERLVEEGRFRWYLKDLDSANGTYARVKDAIVHSGQEIMIGGHRYRFEAAPESPAALAAQAQGGSPSGDDGTQKLQTLPAGGAMEKLPSLVEITSEGEGKRFPLDDREHWIGSDSAKCTVVVEDDPYVEPHHARLFQDERQRWHIESHDSLNGTWVRIQRVRIDVSGAFQAGEQRFLVKIP